MSTSSPCLWAIVPAAGRGRRAGDGPPKQYRLLDGVPIVEKALAPFLEHPNIARTFLVIAKGDEPFIHQVFPSLPPSLEIVYGDLERSGSVYQALLALSDRAGSNDWVLVHDVARPYLSTSVLNRLIDALINHPVGGILAMPVRDTLKRANPEGNIAATLPRDGLWQAQTPQMFRFGLLFEALSAVCAGRLSVTDEAHALELLGFSPVLVPNFAQNSKITYPEDL